MPDRFLCRPPHNQTKDSLKITVYVLELLLTAEREPAQLQVVVLNEQLQVECLPVKVRNLYALNESNWLTTRKWRAPIFGSENC